MAINGNHYRKLLFINMSAKNSYQEANMKRLLFTIGVGALVLLAILMAIALA
jgi:hypothetical protein